MTSAVKKLQEKRANGEEGFTLIELLVVIIIIGILAAIAIPVFLNQREKGWDAAVQSDLRNIATAQETVLTDGGNYTTNLTTLAEAGFKQSGAANYNSGPVVTATGGTSYCATAVSKSGTTYKYDSVTGPATGTC